MAENAPLRIASIANDPNPDWAWIRDIAPAHHEKSGRRLDWSTFSSAPNLVFSNALLQRIAKKSSGIARFTMARRIAKQSSHAPFDLIVSHGPWQTAWVEHAIRTRKGKTRHLAYSFNFTDLPTGPRRSLMASCFKSVDGFAVFTDAEEDLYADYFSIPKDKIFRAPWGVAPPITNAPPREIDEPYVASLGGEARDYGALCEAARLSPQTQFVAIARPHNFDALNAPPNLKVLFNLPFERAWGIVWHADAAVLPLRDCETPCGLVTLVGTMHLGKAQIATDAAGIREYLRHEETGLMTPPRDGAAIASAIRRLESDPALRDRLGAAAGAFASTHCDESATVRFFLSLLDEWY